MNKQPHSLKPSHHIDHTLARGKTATKHSFFIAGFAIASWAPLVPYAQARLQADPATLGTILLCLGLGAVIGMPLASALSGRLGTKRIIVTAAASLVLTLPLLALLSNTVLLALCLLLFGAAIGAIDVAGNIHGTEVQHLAEKPLMSSFHGFYSIGGLVGASGMTLGLASGISVVTATMLGAGAILLSLLCAANNFMPTHSQEQHPLFILPRGKVITIGLLIFVIFLAEGAMLDWSALLLTQEKSLKLAYSGAGYVLFAIAMTFSRFCGESLILRFGERNVLLAGMVVTGLGLICAALASPLWLVMLAIALAGLAVGNLVPILFILAGRQKTMPMAHAIAAISILGYGGVLLGPAMIGYISHAIGLKLAFASTGVLVLLCIMGIRSLMRQD